MTTKPWPTREQMEKARHWLRKLVAITGANTPPGYVAEQAEEPWVKQLRSAVFAQFLRLRSVVDRAAKEPRRMDYIPEETVAAWMLMQALLPRIGGGWGALGGADPKHLPTIAGDDYAALAWVARVLDLTLSDGYGGPGKPETPRVARDRYCYLEACKGTPWRAIWRHVESVPEWPPVGSEEAVAAIARRYAKNHPDEPPIPGRRKPKATAGERPNKTKRRPVR